MDNLKILGVCLVVLVQSCSTYRQADIRRSLQDAGEITAVCPDAVNYLPGYPSFDDKEAFFNDSLQYSRGKALRETERGEQAVEDADHRLEFYLSRFGEVLGVELSTEATPAVAKYIKEAYTFARSGIGNAKKAYKRERPFSYFEEQSSIPQDEERFGHFTSYPSGHALRGWVIALAFISIDEEHRYDIIKVGYELGQSRVISGYHFQSDVDAARLCASVGYASIVSDPEFIKLQNLARKELAALRAGKK